MSDKVNQYLKSLCLYPDDCYTQEDRASMATFLGLTGEVRHHYINPSLPEGFWDEEL